MKYLICLLSMAMTVSVPTIALADESIDSEEFVYLVCSYIEDSSSLENALNKINNVADNLSLSDSQEQDLEDLEEGILTSEVYCMNLEF